MRLGGPRLAGWRRAGAVALLALSGCSSAPTEPAKTPMRGQQQGRLPGVPDQKIFVEADIAPPPYPAESTLVEFVPQGQTSNRFYVDGSSLTVDEDTVIRFILLIRTPENVSNVRFSGLRCSTREWKDYALARTDHTWIRDQDPSWQPIQNTNLNNYRWTLYNDFFCINGVISKGSIGDAKKLVKRLKHPPQSNPRVPGKGQELLQ